MTLPPSENDKKTFNQSHYIFAMSEVFMRSAGLFPVYIKYDISDKDLYTLLDQINGVYFTGGDINLFNETTGEPHPYSVTAKKIL